MPSLNGNFVVSKTVFISGSLAMGSGAMYLFYHMYTFSKQLKRLNCQIMILTDKVYRAETDVIELRRQFEQTGSSDDVDEFVDASEDDQGSISILNSMLSNSTPKVKNEKKCVKKVEDILNDLDIKIDDAGFEDLNSVFKHLNELVLLHPLESGIYWRISKAAYLLAEEKMLPHNNPEERHKQLMSQAKEAAEKAVKLSPQSGDAHRWAAIILGSITQYMPTQDQIKSAYLIKDHIETAIKYKPDDALLHHMLGRWCYSVYMLTWVERKVATALFGTPPTATLKEAMGHLRKAEKLNPLSSISNQLYLAKSFIADRDYKKAVDCLKTGKKLKRKTADDRRSQDEVLKLLKQYESYAS